MTSVDDQEILDSLFGDDEENEKGNTSKVTNLVSACGALQPSQPPEIPRKKSPSRLAEIRPFPSAAGGRGLFARRNIPAGFLILAEVPILRWEGKNLGIEEDLCQVIEAVLHSKDAYRVIQSLHPIMIEDADEEDVLRASTILTDERVAKIVASIEVCEETRNNSISKSELIKILLSLQHNGFASGLYGILTMINHNCCPNAIKFSPTAGSLGASEIWSVRDIKEGEEITICYCEPSEATTKSRQEFLIAHHRFKCNCTACLAGASSERSIDDSYESKLQDIIKEIEAEFAIWRSLDDNIVSGGIEGVAKLMKMATSIAFQRVDEGLHSLSPQLLARLFLVSANVSALLLEKAQNKTANGRRPKASLLRNAASSFLRCNLRLLDQQLKYLGSSHPDVGSTNGDIAEGLSCLLESFPEELLVLVKSPSIPVEIDTCLYEVRQVLRLSSSGGREGKVSSEAVPPSEVVPPTCKGEVLSSDSDSASAAARVSFADTEISTTNPETATAEDLISTDDHNIQMIRPIVKRIISRYRVEAARIQDLYSRRHLRVREEYMKTLMKADVGVERSAGMGVPGSCYWGDYISTED